MIDTEPALDLIRSAIPDGKPTWTGNIAFWMRDPHARVRLYGEVGHGWLGRTRRLGALRPG